MSAAEQSSPDKSWRLLALPPLDPELLRALLGGPSVEVIIPDARDQATVTAAVRGIDIIVGDWSGKLRIDATVVEAADRLVFVQQPSAGVDTLDLEALTGAGVAVANAGPANAVSVAEWCVGATFAVLRSLVWADTAVRSGDWPQLEITQRGGGELAGRRVGIVGMGRVGVECAVRYAALGCDVAHWSRSERPAAEAGGARWLPLDELLAHADVLVVVVALAPETRGLIGAEQLARLPAGSFVIDAARGGVVDEAALLAAMDGGAIAGAALDVFETEPLSAESPLRGNDRILLSPHAAGLSREAISRLTETLIDNVRRAAGGETVRYVVNGEDTVVRRKPEAS